MGNFLTTMLLKRLDVNSLFLANGFFESQIPTRWNYPSNIPSYCFFWHNVRKFYPVCMLMEILALLYHHHYKWLIRRERSRWYTLVTDKTLRCFYFVPAVKIYGSSDLCLCEISMKSFSVNLMVIPKKPRLVFGRK